MKLPAYKKYNKRLLSCVKSLISKNNWWGPEIGTHDCTTCKGAERAKWIIENRSSDKDKEDPAVFFELLAICQWLVKSYPYVTESCINDLRKETKGCVACRAIEKTKNLIKEILT
jgi:hypothetical protein